MLGIYQLTKCFPDCERFGIVSQLRRAAVSVPTNIAEGSKRLGSQDYARFINIAEGSLAETEYLLLLSQNLEYLTPLAAVRPLAETADIGRMLNALRQSVVNGR